MKKRMLSYSKQITQFMDQPHSEREYEDFRNDVLDHIHFYQHERLIHLIVTCLFAILAFSVFITLLFLFTPGLLLLFLALLLLLVPYIRHYYFLENTVQKMYDQYESLLALCRNSKKSSKKSEN